MKGLVIRMVISPESVREQLDGKVSSTEFIVVYPSVSLTSPVRGRYLCTISCEYSCLMEFNENSESYKYTLRLISPLKSSGSEIYKKAEEVTNCFMKLDFNSYNVQCNMGNISYSESMRCYCADMQFTIESFRGTSGIIRIDNFVRKIFATKVSAKTNTFDIMSYGSSKPVDTILGRTEYKLTIKADTDLYDIFKNDNDTYIMINEGDKTIFYSNLNFESIQTENLKGQYAEYQITAYERQVVSE